MGTRINILFPHESDWLDRDETMRALSPTSSIAQEVAAYWTDGVVSDSPDDERWIAEHQFPPPEPRDFHRYSGPGPLFVSVNPSTVRVRTGGRWRGFLSIQPLRTIHIRAFTAIANAFDASVMRCFSDNDIVDDTFWNGGNFDACVNILDVWCGSPVRLEELVDPYVAAQTDAASPLLQYVHTLQ